MLEMHKQKLAGDQRHLGLSGEIRGGQRGGSHMPKTKLQSYHEHDYESILAVRKKNRKKLAVDPARRELGKLSGLTQKVGA